MPHLFPHPSRVYRWVTVFVSLGSLLAMAGCVPGPASGTRSWTVLIYMAADNNLDQYAQADLNEMKEAASASGMSVVVQYDPSGPGQPTERMSIDHSTKVELADLGETDTGMEETLRDFLTWGVSQFPANHYALIIWNHGSGVWDPPQTQPPGTMSPHAVAFDDGSNGDALTTEEYSQAIKDAEWEAGFHLDVLGFDACLMQMVEVAAEMSYDDGKPAVDYIVGSEGEMPGDGFDYTSVLGWLAEHYMTGAAGFSRWMVESFAHEYAGQDATISVVDLASPAWGKLIKSLSDLSAAVAGADPETLSRLHQAALAARHFSVSFAEFKDLADFARLVRQGLADQPALAGPASDIYSLVTGGKIVIDSASTGSLDDGSVGGLSVCIPDDMNQYDRYGYYADLRLAIDTGWQRVMSALAQQD